MREREGWNKCHLSQLTGGGGKGSRKTLVKKYGPLSYSLSNLIHAEAGTEFVYETA